MAVYLDPYSPNSYQELPVEEEFLDHLFKMSHPCAVCQGTHSRNETESWSHWIWRKMDVSAETQKKCAEFFELAIPTAGTLCLYQLGKKG